MMNTPENPFQTQGARLMTQWMLRLATDKVFGYIINHDPHMFSLFYAAAATAVPPPDELVPEAEQDNGSYADQLLPTLKDLQRQFGPSVSGRFTQYYLDGIAVHAQMRKGGKVGFGSEPLPAMAAWRESAEAEAASFTSSTERNVQHLAKLIGLSQIEADILLMQLYRRQPGFSQLFDALMQTQHAAAYVMATMLGTNSHADVIDALQSDGLLVRSGLLRVNERPLRIDVPSEYLRSAMSEEIKNEEDFARLFVRPLRKNESTASVARMDDRDRVVLSAMMRLPDIPEHGLHALVYGPDTVDKPDLIARIMEDEGLTAWAVQTRKVQSSDLPAWTFIAQKWMADHHPNDVLVIDRAERAFTQRASAFMVAFGLIDEDDDENDREASDTGLIGASARCIWLTDRVRSIEEKILGKFLFHCEARPGSRADRRERVQQVISEFQLSDELQQHLSQYNLLGEQQVSQAARLAKLVVRSDEEHDPVVRRAVFQAQRVLGRSSTEGLRQSVTAYSLDNLNVQGKFQPDQIIKALKRMPQPQGSICFYGLPGSGKTQLAEFMAVELDMPIIMKRASDLLDKYVGENEKNASAMFAEAEAEGAILFLDEADSFIRDRSQARAEWSVSLVNEMLQNIERFPGVFIAATNLMDDVDAAALRRFTWKLEFMPLKADQAWNMFLAEAQPDLTGVDVEQLRSRVVSIPDLTPGDFAVIKRQINMLGEEISADDWIVQLTQEAKAKMKGLRRQGLGFGANN
jgi:hypothetical protein